MRQRGYRRNDCQSRAFDITREKRERKINDDVAIEKGSVVFANANEKMTLTSSDEGGISIYRAQVNTRVF